MFDNALVNLAELLAVNNWWAPFIAFSAGVITSLTPCAFTSVPLVIGYVGSGTKDTGKAFRLALVFAMGMSITFTVLGAVVALVGGLFIGAGSWWYVVLGILMVLMALQTFELFEFIPSTYLTARNKRRGYSGAILTGLLAGLFASPCATPVLVVLLGLVAGSGSVSWGILILLCYAIGHSMLVIATGTSVGFARSITGNPRYGIFSLLIKYSLGAIMLLMAFYLFYMGF